MPASKNPELATALARRSVLKRHHPNADVTGLEREIKTLKLEDYIRALVDSAPALTIEQRDRLALLLRGSNTKNSAAA